MEEAEAFQARALQVQFRTRSSDFRPLRHFTFRLSIRRSHRSRSRSRSRTAAASIRHQIINTSWHPPSLSCARAARAWRNIIYADFCETKASNLNCRKRCRQRSKRNKREN